MGACFFRKCIANDVDSSALLSFGFNIMGFILVKNTSSVTAAMLGNLKIVIVIVFAAALMGAAAEPVNIVGYCFSVLAACSYTGISLDERGQLVRQRVGIRQPWELRAVGGGEAAGEQVLAREARLVRELRRGGGGGSVGGGSVGGSVARPGARGCAGYGHAAARRAAARRAAARRAAARREAARQEARSEARLVDDGGGGGGGEVGEMLPLS